MTRPPHSCSRHSLVLATLVTSVFMASTVSAVPPERVEVIIEFPNLPGPAEKRLVEKHGGQVKRTFRIVNAVSASLPAAAAMRVRNEAGVISVVADGKVEAHDLEKTWGVKRIQCGPVHAGMVGPPVLGTGVKVAIVDTGIDYTHPELRLNYAGGYDFANNDSNPYDDDGHGTHVAGTVAALRNGSGAVGAAPEAALYGIKVLGADGSGSWSWILAGLDWCVDNGVDVANFSLGSSSHPGRTVERAFENAAASGLLMIASAGNDGEGSDTVGYPAKFSSVVAVASTTKTDGRSSFSSTGPSVELAAPGSGILSTLRGGGFGFMSGTSMASPHVAGVAALVIAAGVVDTNGNGRINDDVRAILQMTAQDLGTIGEDDHFGHGLVNAATAVLLASNPTSESLEQIEFSLANPLRPDGTIGTSRRTMIGENLYTDTGTRQVVRRRSRSRYPVAWEVRFANDGSAAGDLMMKGTRGNKRYRMTYLKRDEGMFSNVSAALKRGYVDSLRGGEGTNYRVLVNPRRRAFGRREEFHFRIRGVSASDSTRVDRVNGVLRNRTRASGF